MSQNSIYRPHLPSDQRYLSGIANSITAKDQFEVIPFHYLTEALISLGITEDPYSLVSLDNLNPQSLQLIIDVSFKQISNTSLSNATKEHILRLWDYLTEEDEISKSDLIFVFGGPGINRVNEAVRLWKDGMASHILFTGQKASYMKDIDMAEAQYYAQIARADGVKEDALIIEDQAKNTPENVVNSIRILREKELLPQRVILITLMYHMRRSYFTFKSAADWNPVILRHPVPSEKYSRESFFMEHEGWSYVFFEYIKMYGARLMKHF